MILSRKYFAANYFIVVATIFISYGCHKTVALANEWVYSCNYSCCKYIIVAVTIFNSNSEYNIVASTIIT